MAAAVLDGAERLPERLLTAPDVELLGAVLDSRLRRAWAVPPCCAA
ncbi:hypothetical protein MRQ86_14690 [Streptomyces sp. MMS21 TC-5]|nr:MULTISPECIES: hypothetical protein [unclassified Streptomyces]MCI4081568.1 hypothetical protein [Streptomyces sp. MMS21 TC-5]